MQVEWTESALEDMARLDKGIARRVKNGVERSLDRRRKGQEAPRHRSSRVPPPIGDYRVRFEFDQEIMRVLRVLTGVRHIAEKKTGCASQRSVAGAARWHADRTALWLPGKWKAGSCGLLLTKSALSEVALGSLTSTLSASGGGLLAQRIVAHSRIAARKDSFLHFSRDVRCNLSALFDGMDFFSLRTISRSGVNDTFEG